MGYIIIFMIGAFVGVWIMCAMIAAHDADEREERMDPEDQLKSFMEDWR